MCGESLNTYTGKQIKILGFLKVKANCKEYNGTPQSIVIVRNGSDMMGRNLLKVMKIELNLLLVVYSSEKEKILYWKTKTEFSLVFKVVLAKN